MKKPILVIMAAGMGSRYGGLKQIDPVDAQGHIIMDFSIYDAVQAGFRKVVFIIKKENEKAYLEIKGDASFVEFLGVENNNGILRINVKNPTGSDTKWIPYDRGNYNKRNIITLHTGKEHCQIYVINYLDLHCYESETDDHINQWIFMKERL